MSEFLKKLKLHGPLGRYVLQVAGCRLQVEKWTFKSELVYLALRLA